jgi:polyphosphate:AMP phosphotransferase
MFDSANLDHTIDKATWKAEEPKLREALIAAQVDLAKQARFPVLILIAGVEGAGKGETVNLLHEWMDPRYLHAHGFGAPSEEERLRPPMWRYWQALPPKGRVGVFFGAWHSQPIVDRAFGRIDEGDFERRIVETLAFEKMLSDEGVLILKFWFHLTKKQQKKRLTQLASGERTAWRVTDQDWEFLGKYDEFAAAAEHYLRRTSTGEAPWIVVSGADPAYRSIAVGRTLVSAMRERLDEPPAGRQPDRNPPLLPMLDGRNVLRALKLNQPTEKSEYEAELEQWQGRLAVAVRDPRFSQLSVVAAFEGNDAAGKGGAIRRITAALDARCYRGIAIAAPTEEERAQPYLWRFWRYIPKKGRIAIFDRSWYGRVLVERVEGFAREADWMRAYGEINDFEAQLVHDRTVVVKFWLAIDADTQLQRFKDREQTAFKAFKITPEDWRNRDKWDAYEAAVCDMVDRTSTALAPWTLVEANNKYFARLKVLRTLVAAVEAGLETIDAPKKKKKNKKLRL